MHLVMCQFAPVLGDVNANLRRLLETVSTMEGDLFVFPELYLSGYLLRDRMRYVALDEGSEPINDMAGLTSRSGKAILVGLPLRDREVDGVIWNAAIMVGPDGETSIYRKVHLPTFGPFEEGRDFKPGSWEGVRPLRMPWGTLGITICYDMFFPEMYMRLARSGADIIVNISNAPVTSREMFERLIHARAIENTVYLAYCNRVGVELGMVFHGGSIVVDPRGRTVASSPLFDEDVLECRLDMDRIRTMRRARPVLRDATLTF